MTRLIWLAAALAALLVSAITFADADDDPMQAIAKRGADAAALAIVASKRCPDVFIRTEQLEHFLSLTGQSSSDQNVVDAVNRVTSNFGRLTASELTARCLQAFDELGPYQANLLGRR